MVVTLPADSSGGPCVLDFILDRGFLRQFLMRLLLLLVLLSYATAQPALHTQISHTTESLRGVSAVSPQIAWASGTHGTYLRTTDGGSTWIPAQVPDATALDFRAVVAFSAAEAFLMSAGPGDQSRIYHTADGGRHWQLQFTNTNPKGFFDSMAFWDSKHAVVLGDPVPDTNGKLRFELLGTEDGQNWRPLPASQLPEAIEGEGAFAASNSCIAMLPSNKDPNIWFATGGKVARVFHSPDRGQTWKVFDTPIIHGPDSAGIFSTVFRDALHGMIAGGDYKHPNDDVDNLAFTNDGGKTWSLEHNDDARGFLSAVAYLSQKSPPRWFLVGADYVARFYENQRVKYPERKFNAVSPIPNGGAMIVGAKGAIAVVP